MSNFKSKILTTAFFCAKIKTQQGRPFKRLALEID